MLQEVIQLGPNHPYMGATGNRNQSCGEGYQQGGYGQQQMQMQMQHSYVYQSQGGYQNPQQPSYGLASYNQSNIYGSNRAQQYDQGQNQAQAQAPQPYGVAPPPAAPEWKVATAPDGQQYYYNERSGETTWQKPAGMA